jgi:hypothetical protein
MKFSCCSTNRFGLQDYRDVPIRTRSAQCEEGLRDNRVNVSMDKL